MALGFAATRANEILNYHIRGVAYTPNTTYYLKLHTAAPGAAGTTAAAGNATRKAVVLANVPSGGIVLSTAIITWSTGEVTTNETYSHWSLWSAATAGTFEMSGALNAPQAVVSGIAVDVAVGGLAISLSVAT